MTTEMQVLVLFSLLFILTNCFWAYTCHILVNKLMSRNYGEVVMADKYKRQKDRARETNEVIDNYARAQAEKANKLIGL